MVFGNSVSGTSSAEGPTDEAHALLCDPMASHAADSAVERLPMQDLPAGTATPERAACTEDPAQRASAWGRVLGTGSGCRAVTLGGPRSGE